MNSTYLYLTRKIYIILFTSLTLFGLCSCTSLSCLPKSVVIVPSPSLPPESWPYLSLAYLLLPSRIQWSMQWEVVRGYLFHILQVWILSCTCRSMSPSGEFLDSYKRASASSKFLIIQELTLWERRYSTLYGTTTSEFYSGVVVIHVRSLLLFLLS